MSLIGLIRSQDSRLLDAQRTPQSTDTNRRKEGYSLAVSYIFRVFAVCWDAFCAHIGAGHIATNCLVGIDAVFSGNIRSRDVLVVGFRLHDDSDLAANSEWNEARRKKQSERTRRGGAHIRTVGDNSRVDILGGRADLASTYHFGDTRCTRCYCSTQFYRATSALGKSAGHSKILRLADRT